MQKIHSIHDIAVLTASPKMIRSEDLNRIGLIVQNQETTANIFLRSGGDGHARSYLKFKPDGNMDENILPPTQELWAYTDSATGEAILTMVTKYVERI